MDSGRSTGPKFTLILVVEGSSVNCEHNPHKFPLRHNDFIWSGAHVKDSSF